MPQPATPPRIGLFGLFGIGNFGNDASLEATVELVRRISPQAELLAICPPEGRPVGGAFRHVAMHPQPAGSAVARAVDRCLLGLPRRGRLWLHAYRALGRLDVLLVAGTGMLDDMGTGPGGMPLMLLAWSAMARLRGRRVGLVCVGAGPVRSRLSRWLFRAAAACACHVSYRDRLSRRYMRRIGSIRPDAAVYPDLVLGLDRPARPDVTPQPRSVGIGIMAYCGWAFDPVQGADIYATYLAKMSSFILWLLRQGYHVRLLIGDERDETAVRDLLQQHGAELQGWSAAITAERTGSLDEVLEQMARTELVVVTRYHHVIAAVMRHVPVISLGYSAKNQAAMREVGLQRYCQHVERLDIDRLTRDFRALWDDRHRHAAQLAHDHARLQGRLEELCRHLADSELLAPAAAQRSRIVAHA